MRRVLVGLLISLLLLPAPVWSAVTFVSVTNGTLTTDQTSQSTSVTVPSGSDRLMVVCILSTGSSAAASSPPTAVVFNTTETLTLAVNKTAVISALHELSATLYYLIAPTETTANVTVTWVGLNDRLQAVSVLLYTGAAQASVVDALADSSGASGTSTTPSTTITTTVNNSMIIDCAGGEADAGLTVESSQTMRVDRVGGPVTESQGVSELLKATAGADTMDWTQASDEWIITAAAFKEAVAAGGSALQSGGVNVVGAGL